MDKEIKNLQLEPNTLKAKIHIDHDNHNRKEFNRFVRSSIQNSQKLPSGYSLIEGEGGWFPDSKKDEIEPKSILEVWIDSKTELKAVRNFKELLEIEFNQHCCCLELQKVRIEHGE